MPASRILMATNTWPDASVGGRQQLCELNRVALRGLYGDRLHVLELPRRRLRGAREIADAFRGHIDGVDDAAIRLALEAIRARDAGKVFIDGSNLGAVVEAVKREFPKVEVTTFCHNVEARFFLGMLRHEMTARSLALLAANFFAERKAAAYSDKIICLSERDSAQLRRVHGRGATHISAIAVQDKAPAAVAATAAPATEPFALFVGGAFYANREGIRWFVERVAPRIAIQVRVAGRGMDDLRPALERAANVRVVGAVEDLAGWYRSAHFVIAPVFGGSGMKTKVAEALMFGKRVAGTPEAFSGYADVAQRAGWLCRNADEFVDAIGRAADALTQPYHPELRALYEDRYSLAAAQARLGRILEERPPRS